MKLNTKNFKSGRILISLSIFLKLPYTEYLVIKRYNTIFKKRLYARLKRNKRVHSPFGGKNGCVIRNN